MSSHLRTISALMLLLLLLKPLQSQDETNRGAMYRSWALFQLVPSPVIYQDSDNLNSKVQLGLRWQIIPINISFRSNKYTSPVQFFKINPVQLQF